MTQHLALLQAWLDVSAGIEGRRDGTSIPLPLQVDSLLAYVRGERMGPLAAIAPSEWPLVIMSA